MVKVEGIYKGLEKIGQEVLLDGKGFELIFGSGKKEKFFESIDEDIDFSLFMHHVNWIQTNRLSGYSFVNLKPSTLIKYSREILRVIKGKIVVEMREDHMDNRELERIIRIRSDFPFLLSLDDFGRKSSNLDRIAHLNPNFVKIDLSLFSSGRDLVYFVNFLRSYSRSSVLIAEKVENERHYRMIKGAGIKLWQGFYEKSLEKEKDKNLSLKFLG